MPQACWSLLVALTVRSPESMTTCVSAVRFLLLVPEFPRSVASCATRIRDALTRLPRSANTLPAVDELDRVLTTLPTRADDGAALDAAMDDVQVALAGISSAITDSFARSGL